jgi:hypothetical protein
MEGDLFTSPGAMEILPPGVHPPDPGTIAPPGHPSFTVDVDSLSSNWILLPHGALAPDDSCREGLGATVSTELIELSLSSPTIWGEPCDSTPEISLALDAGKASIVVQKHSEGASASSTSLGMTSTLEEAGIIIITNLPSADDNTSIAMTSNSVGSFFRMHGPDPGAAGVVNAISMTADVSEARMGINTDAPTSALYVDGDIVATGAITELSDIRLKEHVTDIEDALEIIHQIRGVRFEWRKDQSEFASLPEGTRVGLIAQEIEKVLPEAVLSPAGSYKSVDYSRLTPVLVAAIKEQQLQIDELKELVYQLTRRSTEQTDR